ncbi:MAG: hypothetical protein DCC67_01400 [Planctomycetota bacterium]|nr:MAG: hypothetical protein DCC67_01400 [Planctomycetota bacterium]
MAILSAASPLLVIADAASPNPFGGYVAEILRGEGLHLFDQLDRSAWMSGADPAGALSSHSAVILAEMALSADQQQLLRDYVRTGGVLIAARPDRGLSDVFGIEPAGERPQRTLQYFGVDPLLAPGRGVAHGALQYHGAASNYALQGATALAYFYANGDMPSENPAVTTHAFGQGTAIALAFDPAKSVVLSRQGNPAWANTEGDGIAQYRPHDFFTRTDGRTWYDPQRMAVPHADELQRLVANVLIDAHQNPLPRMWYLPGRHKSLLVNTGDGEDNFGAQFDAVLNDAASYGGKFSVYLRDSGVANTTAAKEAEWRAAGHEVGVHMYADGLEGPGAAAYMDYAYSRIVGAVQSKFGHPARTARSHTIDWTGWVDMARIEADHGTQLDANYYHYLNGAVVDPLAANGYFTGSGLPQRLIDEEGRLLDVYQAATQWPDEWFADNGFTAQQAIDVMTGMFEAAETSGYYSAFVANIHPVRYYGPDVTYAWTQAIWQYCQQRGIPMWSAEMLLDFVLARAGSTFENLQYADHGFQFDFVAGASGFDLTLMIPVDWDDLQLQQVLVDDVPAELFVETIKGVDYGMFTPRADQAHIAAIYQRPLTADFNEDGRVDSADLDQWQTDFGIGPSADADADGDADGADFLAWQRRFGASGVVAATVVPEPGSGLLASVLLCVIAPRLDRGIRVIRGSVV